VAFNLKDETALQTILKDRTDVITKVAAAKTAAGASEPAFAAAIAGHFVGCGITDAKEIGKRLDEVMCRALGNVNALGDADKRRKSEWTGFAVAGACGYFSECDDAVVAWLADGGKGERMKRLRTLLSGKRKGSKNPAPAKLTTATLTAYFADDPQEKLLAMLTKLADNDLLTKAEKRMINDLRLTVKERGEEEPEEKSGAPDPMPKVEAPLAASAGPANATSTAPIDFGAMLANLQGQMTQMAAMIAKKE